MNKLSILIIDDEEVQRESIGSYLKRRDYDIHTSENGENGIEYVFKNVVDIVLTDFRMPGLSGLEVLKKIKEINPEIDVVIITAFGNVQDAVDLMKMGAYDYLTKPVDLDELDSILDRLKEKRYLQSENKMLKQQLEEKYRFDSIISQSSEMESVLSTVARVSNSKATVLVRGESGTGKELIAKAIHYSGARKEKPFITINIAALSGTLLESELFGHEKGSFTGAVSNKTGKFELADEGTIFIDEIGEIPLPLQVKLLRVLQFGEIEKVGNDTTKKVDVRFIGATHRNLEEMISKGEFREDLYYRINVVQIWLAPLKKRKTDIPSLAYHFINKYKKENNKEILGMSKEALDKLIKYDFPGNVRELENIIERAVVLCRGEYITTNDFPGNVNQISERGVLDPYNLKDGYESKMQSFEKEMLVEALQQSGGNQSAAARLLGITERHLRSRLERTGLK